MGLIDRFMSKVVFNDCWEWTAKLAPNGYGRIGRGGRIGGMEYAHRVAWELFRGPIAKGLCVLHRCDNRKCVKPDHLFIGTLADNNRDCVRKGRNSRGVSRYNAKLTPEKAAQIRERYGKETVTDLASAYGVSRNAIFQVASNRTWR